MVGVRGFEPPASWSRTKRSTKLSHTPNITIIYKSTAKRNSFCKINHSLCSRLTMILLVCSKKGS